MVTGLKSLTSISKGWFLDVWLNSNYSVSGNYQFSTYFVLYFLYGATRVLIQPDATPRRRVAIDEYNR